MDINRLRSEKSKLSEGSGSDFECSMVEHGNNQVRPVGDYEMAFRHWITDGAGKNRMINCKGPESDCLVCRLVREKRAIDEDKRDDIDSDIANNWAAKKVYFFNVIDRKDEWCKKNKHSKVLSQYKIGGGVGPKLFGEIADVADVNGDWDKGSYDIMVTKKGTNLTTDYKAQALREEIALTDEEKKYVKYDLSTIAIPTAKSKVEQILGIAVEHVAAEGEKKPVAAEVKSHAQASAPAQEVQEEKKPAKLQKKDAPQPLKKKETMKEDCPECGTTIEFSKGDATIVCPKCKGEFEIGQEENPFVG